MAHIVPNEGKAKIHAFNISQCADFSVVTDGGRRRSRTPQDSHLECDLELFGVTLVAAREWKLFQDQGLDVEIILMRSAAAAAALVSGDLDYQSGIGPASIQQ